MDAPFTLKDLARHTGLRPRTIQFWADGGVLHGVSSTDRAGTGTRRRFGLAELRVAVVLAPLDRLGLPIGQIRVAALALRGIATGGDNFLLLSFASDRLLWETTSVANPWAFRAAHPTTTKDALIVIDLNACLSGLPAATTAPGSSTA